MMIDITRQVNTTLYLLMLAIGLDFTISGYFVLRDKSLTHVPKLVSFRFLQLFAWAEKVFAKRRSPENVLTKLAKPMYTVRAAGIYLILSDGPLTILASLLLLAAS